MARVVANINGARQYSRCTTGGTDGGEGNTARGQSTHWCRQTHCRSNKNGTVVRVNVAANGASILDG
eukprot:1553587-Lingulodinium_polyedra.AAC.1